MPVHLADVGSVGDGALIIASRAITPGENKVGGGNQILLLPEGEPFPQGGPVASLNGANPHVPNRPFLREPRFGSGCRPGCSKEPPRHKRLRLT